MIRSVNSHLLISTFTTLILSSSVECQHNETIEWLIKYKFIQFNDSENVNTLIDNDNLLIEGIKNFQWTTGFPITGQLDDIQMNAMHNTMCLSRPPPFRNDMIKNLRYWRKRELTWTYFQPYKSAQLPTTHKIEEMIQRAFDLWTANISLRIYQNRENERRRSDINIHFYDGNHTRQSPICELYPFDGPGHILGHGFFPHIGELHLDLSEYWGIFLETRRDLHQFTDLFSVIFHEIGHVLGLSHSPFKINSAMHAFYHRPKTHWKYYKMTAADSLAIKRLYPGINQQPTILPWDTTTTAITNSQRHPTYFTPKIPDKPTTPIIPPRRYNPQPTTPIIPPRRYNPQPKQPMQPTNKNKLPRLIDAAISVNNELIVIKDEKLWRMGFHGIIKGYPTNIDEFFSGENIPKNIDSIYQRSVDKYITVFSNEWYYLFHGNRLLRHYPKRIVDLLGVDDRIIDIKPLEGNEYLVYYFGRSCIFLVNEYTNRVVYVVNFERRHANSLTNINIKAANDDLLVEFINKDDLYITSASAVVNKFINVFSVIVCCIFVTVLL